MYREQYIASNASNQRIEKLLCTQLARNALLKEKECKEYRMARKGRKRLAMDVPTKIHEEIRQYAKARNITITKWVLRAIYAKLLLERQSN